MSFLKRESKAVKLAAPWTVYYRQINALFQEDKDIKVVFNEIDSDIDIYVENQEKASALNSLLPVEKKFGNVKIKINVISANGDLKKTESIDDILKLFNGNEAVVYTRKIDLQTNPMLFIVFKKEVVQFFNDDLGDIHGLCSTLYQDLAKEIFKETKGVYFCTDSEEPKIFNLWEK